MKNIKKIINALIILLLIILLYLFLNPKIKGWYINQIEYDMCIEFHEYPVAYGGYSITRDYVLINTKTGIAYYINHYNIYGQRKLIPDKYTIKKFNLTNFQINKLIEYANKNPEEIKIETTSNPDSKFIDIIEYLEIKYENKNTILKESSAQEILNFIDKRNEL